jgi:hypothetical protein
MGTPRRALLFFAAAYAVLLSRFSVFEEPYFRPFELLIDGPARFRPDKRVEMEEHGALSYRTWVEELKLRHRVVFTTDRAGLRNPTLHAPPRVVVLGDSFIAGVGLSDEETLPARLTAILGEQVYNFGAQGVEALPLFLADQRFAKYPPKVAVYAPSLEDLDKIELPKPMTREEFEEHERRQLEHENSPVTRALAVHHAISERIERVRTVIDRDNGLGHLAKQLVHGTRYRLFGPPNAIVVDGEWALVETLAEQRLFETPEQRELDRVVENIARFAAIMQERGTAFVFCPIPGSGSIYTELFPPEDRARVAEPSFLQLLRERVAARGIRVIDLETPFKRERSPYLYLRDDTHWTPRTVELTAGIVAPVIRDLLMQ